MTNSNKKLQSYFLGELPENEVIRLENEYLGDEAKLAELREAENNLLDDYVNKRLPQTSRKSFEENYLNSPFRRERLEFAKTLAEFVPKESVQTVEKKSFAWRDIFSFGKFGIAFASIILLLFTGFWLMQNPTKSPNNEVAVIKTPEVLPTPLPTKLPENSPIVGKTPTNPNANVNKTNTNVSPTKIPTPTQTPDVSPTPEKIKQNQTVVLALSTIGMRDGGKTSQVILNKESKNLVLQLNVAETEAKVFQVKIANADGKVVYQTKNSRISGKNISLNLPVSILKNDDYIVEVFAVNSAGESEKVSGYSFRVIKK